jgi:hypothetical protein
MKRKTQELTTKQRIKRYRNGKFAAWAGEFVAIPTPFVVMAIINRNEWFPNAETGTRVGIGGGIAIGLMLFALFLVTKEQKKEIGTGYVTIMLGWAMLAAVATLVREIADQIANIMWIGMSGIAAGFGLDITRKQLLKREKREREILKTAQDQRDVARTNEEIAQEEKKTVKIKIKK